MPSLNQNEQSRPGWRTTVSGTDWYETHDDKDVMPDKWSMPKDALTDELVQAAYDIFWHADGCSQSRKAMRAALEFSIAALALPGDHHERE